MGADATVLPSRVGGILMAGSIETSALTSYVMDLISATGRVILAERAVRSDEIGLSPQDINDALAVSVIRGDHELAANDPQIRLQPGDKLLVIRQSRV